MKNDKIALGGTWQACDHTVLALALELARHEMERCHLKIDGSDPVDEGLLREWARWRLAVKCLEGKI